MDIPSFICAPLKHNTLATPKEKKLSPQRVVTMRTSAISFHPRFLRNGQVLEYDLSNYDFSAYIKEIETSLVPKMSEWDDLEKPIYMHSLMSIAYKLFVSHIPQPVIDELLRFPFDLNAPVAVVLRGMPVDNPIPPTPLFSAPEVAQTPIVDAILLGMSRMLGMPVVPPRFSGSRDSIIRSLMPRKSDGQQAHSNLALHRDYANEIIKTKWEPDAFMMLCLRGDHSHQAMTKIISHSSILDASDPKDIELLRKSKVCAKSENLTTDKVPRNTNFSVEWTPVAGSDEDPRFTFFSWDLGGFPQPVRYTVESDVPGAAEAYSRVLEIASRQSDHIDLQKGSLLLLNNIRSCHGRTPYTPLASGDPEQRWMRKLYVSFKGWRNPGSNPTLPTEIADYPSFQVSI